MSITTTAAVAIAVCNAYAAQVEAGSAVSAPYVRIYGGVPPASVRAALSSNPQLGSVSFAADAFAAAADDAVNGYAKALANTMSASPATADGEATFFRVFNRDNEVQWQGSITEQAGGGDLELSTVSLVSGVDIVVQTFELRVPY